MTWASAERTRFGVGLLGLAAWSVIVWTVAWAAIAPAAFGWSPVAVTSGSMEPLIDAGDIVFVESSDGQDLTPGNVIVFDDASGGRVTHRIVDVTPDGDFVTRGDANARVDSTPVAPEDVRGVGRMVVPKMGYPFVWAENGQWILLLCAVVMTAAMAWASRWGLLGRHNPWRGRGQVPPAAPPTPRAELRS